MKILVVEDDRDTSQLLKEGLTADAHSVEIAEDGTSGAFFARSYDFDVIVLDYSLPKKNGLQLCREIRASGKNTPIIFLSSTDDTKIKLEAFEHGADDYMTKPFSMDELRARIKVVLRRPTQMKDSHILQVADLILDKNKQVVTRGGKLISCTRKEFGLLEYMMRNKGVVLSRIMIMEHVWTTDSDPFSNTVEAHIRNLRKKLNNGGKPNVVKNVPGRGYMIDITENDDD